MLSSSRDSPNAMRERCKNNNMHNRHPPLTNNRNYYISGNIVLTSPCQVLHFPNSPENQFAKCLLLTLGVKLITLSLSPSLSLSRSGVSGLWSAGTVLPRGRVGVVLSLFRKLRDFAVRLATVVLDASRLVNIPPLLVTEVVMPSTTRIVAPQWLCIISVDEEVKVGPSALEAFEEICIGGRSTLTQGRTAYR
jgi:hypothetical protein